MPMTKGGGGGGGGERGRRTHGRVFVGARSARGCSRETLLCRGGAPRAGRR